VNCCSRLETRTITVETSQNSLGAISLFAPSTFIAGSASICYGLEAGSLSNFEVLDPFTNFDDDTSALVSCAFGAICGHGAYAPIVQHEVDVAVADPRCVELQEDVFGA
jgi:hypothetical protein